jgi:hypothetical protein
MKKLLFYMLASLLLWLVIPQTALAQNEDDFGGFDLSNPLDKQSSLAALLGYTDIGGEKFVGMRIQPEFVFGKLGFGLDVPIMFDLENFKLRTEEFKDGVGLLRMVRYISWGVKKRDPLFLKVGDLSDSYLGYGILLDNYTNSVSFEKRKVGFSWDILVKNLIGVEGLYSDFDATSRNLLALRPYIKPLGRTSIPIVKTLELGFGFVSDYDKTKIKSDAGDFLSNQFLSDGMKAWSLDMGLMPINRSFVQIRTYVQYGKLLENKSVAFKDSITKYLATSPADAAIVQNYKSSSGISVGADFRLKAAGNVLRVDAKLERLWYNTYFMPQFFNASYEMDKDKRIFGLTRANGKKGIYGALAITAVEKVRVGGSLMIPDDASDVNPAVLTLDFDASKLMDKVILTGYYLKGNLTGLKDAFKLDDRSLLSVRAAYKMYKFLIVGMDYKWTWSKVETEAAPGEKFVATHYASPYIGFHMPFNFGSNSKPIDFDAD